MERIVQVRSSYRDVSANECKSSERPTILGTSYLFPHPPVHYLHGEDDTSPGASAASPSPRYALLIIVECDPSLRDVDAPLSEWRHTVSVHNHVLGFVVFSSNLVIEGNCIIHRVNELRN
ncbi:hypothetical protein ARMGADRAFT_1075000 [Armillaria gallica]|uniref:Uncharacterized protein n=1 Tax=Armillaria gallica TaxID=47427 RepID=A0A2H3DSD8_ARMGA|nr:hypothetical protein ARMGADRAFT_1075000 [Armillaria gallica]